MKLIALAMTIALSTSAFASMPATEAIRNILPASKYEGKSESRKCIVTVETKDDFAAVTITTGAASESFSFLNTSKGILVNESTGEISATQTMNAPYYVRGGTKFLNIQVRDADLVQVSISKILLDHNGNDASTYLDCTLAL